MMKLKALLFMCLFIIFLHVSDADTKEEGVFLCMRDRESTAITAVNGSLRYEEMTDSNGVVVQPIISTDNNTYLPLRFICEKAGLADAERLGGDKMPENSFKFSGEGESARLEIQSDGKHYEHKINEPFKYEADDGSERTVAIYNIDDSLYAPMGYLAKISGCKALWDAKYSRIMFVSGGRERAYLQEDNTIYRNKLMELTYDAFSNHLTLSSLYLEQDGETVADLERKVGSGIRSVTRSGDTVYYIDKNGRVMTYTELAGAGTPMRFRDGDGKGHNLKAQTAIVVKDRLYGIEVNDVKETNGSLFSCALDGSDFKYISSVKAYNLFMKRTGLDYYLFYGDAEDTTKLHLIKLNTMDDYEVSIMDHDGVSLISSPMQFTVGDKRLYYIDAYNSLHYIDLPYSLTDIEIIRTSYDAHHIAPVASDGVKMDNISQMNYDYLNDILYVMRTDKSIYYMPGKADKLRPLDIRKDGAEELSLFSDIGYRDQVVQMVGGRIDRTHVRYDGKELSIGEWE